MLSLFAVPKAFTGDATLVQNNAIASWTRLGNDCEIILLGDDPGTAEAALRYGVGHDPRIARNEFGTPLLSDVVSRMHQRAKFPLLALVNADIILLSDFLPAVQAARNAFRDFLLVASRYNCRLGTPLLFESGWDIELRNQVRTENRMYPAGGSDIFVFPRELFSYAPPFSIGRGYWDNWLMREARSKQVVPLIDATAALTAVHQDHDYGHVSGIPAGGGDAPVYRSDEGLRNLALAGGHLGLYTVFDATHVMTADGQLISTHRPSLVHRRLKASVRRLVRRLRDRDPQPPSDGK